MDLFTILYSCGIAGCIMAVGLIAWPILQAYGLVHQSHRKEDKQQQCLTTKEQNTRRPA